MTQIYYFYHLKPATYHLSRCQSDALFFAVVRFSPPSQEDEVAKRKEQVKNHSPDSQEPIYDFPVVAVATEGTEKL